MSQPLIAVCDLCDAHLDQLRVLDPVFRHFGGRRSFHGAVTTAACFEDNSRVRDAVSEPGAGRVLVVDGGGSVRRSLLGGDLAAKAAANGWSGVVINGACRDARELADTPLGVLALALIPVKTDKRGLGDRDVPVRIAGHVIQAGDYLYADEDGVAVAREALHGG